MTQTTEQRQEESPAKRKHAGVASLAHWASPIGWTVPFAGLTIPLILLLVEVDGQKDSFIKDCAKEALNLFICTFIWTVFFGILCFVLIGIPFMLLLILYHLVFPFVAAIQTMSSDENTSPYRYPFIIRFIK